MSIAEGQSVLPAAELASLADRQLLARFFGRREDAAFAVLVQRHGPLVYRVCRRVLPDANDADDAFQATFLVLVRKGATLKQPERLACWLYGVAYRTSRKIKVRSAIRSKHEREATPMPVSADVDRLTLQELQAILDEEIGRLPEKYALPLTLCYLEGKTNAQAATQLGWPEGSISRRLSRARELLRSRLIRRGLAISAALIAAAFARPLFAVPPHSLIESTTVAGSLLLRGAPLREVVSSQAATAIGEVLRGTTSVARLTASAVLAASSIALLVVIGVREFGMRDGSINSVYRVFNSTSEVTADPGANGTTVSLSAGCHALPPLPAPVTTVPPPAADAAPSSQPPAGQ